MHSGISGWLQSDILVILLMRCCVAVAELEGLKTAVSRVNETARELLAATNPADAPMLKLNLREVSTAAVLGKIGLISYLHQEIMCCKFQRKGWALGVHSTVRVAHKICWTNSQVGHD